MSMLNRSDLECRICCCCMPCLFNSWLTTRQTLSDCSKCNIWWIWKATENFNLEHRLTPSPALRVYCMRRTVRHLHTLALEWNESKTPGWGTCVPHKITLHDLSPGCWDGTSKEFSHVYCSHHWFHSSWSHLYRIVSHQSVVSSSADSSNQPTNLSTLNNVGNLNVMVCLWFHCLILVHNIKRTVTVFYQIVIWNNDDIKCWFCNLYGATWHVYKTIVRKCD